MRAKIAHATLVVAIIGALFFGVGSSGWAWITAVCALVSVVVNARAAVIAHHDPDSVRSPVYAFTAGLSLVYVVAWGMLAAGSIDRAHWSEIMTPVAAFSFLSVWTIHAMVNIQREGGQR